MKKSFFTLILVSILVFSMSIAAYAESVNYENPSKPYKASVYYASLSSVNLTGDEREDVIAVALSQLYYNEGNSTDDFHGLNTSGDGNFTEYCFNYGALDQDGNGTREYGYPWCAAFVTFCLRRAEISKKVAPSHVNCTTWLNRFKESSEYYSYYARGKYTPIKGDIIFFKSTSTARASDHVGLVIGTLNGYVYTVEGNTSGGVYIKCYSLEDTYIVGYAVPKYESEITESTLSSDYIVTARSTLNMRSGPSTSDSVIKTLKRNAAVEIISISNKWAKIKEKSSGMEGYVSLSYIAPKECSQITITFNKNTFDEYTVFAGYNCSVNLPIPEKEGMEFLGFKDSDGKISESASGLLFTENEEFVPAFKEISETTVEETSAPEETSSPEQTSVPEDSEDTEPIKEAGCASVIASSGLISLSAILAIAFAAKRKKTR